ncbi:uncharacterized protein LOC105156444 [Sesamum indicum]|uniref:Uncharacterized protein LOC105156444 n=1 Tax=Sesamum indicum TaxID=4182 RepID=A0A6I9SLU8_SESIN|nr:uncharacterized protein LOC105156444 [Sesamum indicum]
MNERGKAMETYSNFPDFNYSASEMPCKKHPNSSSVGVCAYCLKDRLEKLVCSECGEQRIFSCSCSDRISSSYRNSCSTVEVGRISFLIPQQGHPHSKSRRKDEGSEQVVFLRSSSSSCVEVKKSNGFWRIKRLFRKKTHKKGCGKNSEFPDDESEIVVSDIMGWSRSRSLCSFRGGKNNDLDQGSDHAFSSAKISDVTNGIFFDSDKQYGFLQESEPRKCGFRRGTNQMELDRVYNRSIYPVKESDFSAMDDSAFIDLKFDFSSDCKQDFSAGTISGASDHGESPASSKRDRIWGDRGSCRITVNERGMKRESRSQKVWKWIFK